MVKRTVLLLLALVVLAGNSLADLKLRENTPAQKKLKTYITNVNRFLLDNGEQEINRIFDQLDTVVEMGITSTDDAEVPEGVTVTVYLKYDGIHYLLLRVDDATAFPPIAAAFLQALNPDTMTQAEAMKVPKERASKAVRNPSNSFADHEFDIYKDRETEILNGERPRTYYAYYPNQYADGVSWMQMMIIFPLPEYWDEERGIIAQADETKAPHTEEDWAEGYEGYFSSDKYEHLDVTPTETPEPDSAAAEYDAWR